MIVLKKRAFEPDYTNIVSAARNVRAKRLPLYEHLINSGAIRALTGNDPYLLMRSKDRAEKEEGNRRNWDFWKNTGYDTASREFSLSAILPGNGALGAHKEGCIKTFGDLRAYPWDELTDKFFDTYKNGLEAFEKTCPPGMKAVGGVGNGIFESVQDIVGYENLCYIKSDDEELYAALFEAMGTLHRRVWARFAERCGEAFCVFRFGDDMGYKQQTLISPEDLRRHVFPHYAAIVETAHRAGKPFLLHSCGNLFEVMDDLIGHVKIDAKHSNEDAIAHFSVWAERYGDRIGNFGGIDTDVLCRYDEKYIREYVEDCLARVENRGGIAFGSGNSIPDYVPPEGYLAMVEAVRSHRGE